MIYFPFSPGHAYMYSMRCAACSTVARMISLRMPQSVSEKDSLRWSRRRGKKGRREEGKNGGKGKRKLKQRETAQNGAIACLTPKSHSSESRLFLLLTDFVTLDQWQDTCSLLLNRQDYGRFDMTSRKISHSVPYAACS